MTSAQKLGWVLSGLFGLFMLGASAAPKFMGMAVAQDAMTALGWPDAPLLLIGSLEVACTLLFLIPATGLMGAVLMMGSLGGAIATNLHGNAPLYSHTLFGVFIGIIMWGGLVLRDTRISKVFPLTR